MLSSNDENASMNVNLSQFGSINRNSKPKTMFGELMASALGPRKEPQEALKRTSGVNLQV